MIRPLVALFALLTLALVSAAAAHEHDMGPRHTMAASVLAKAPTPATQSAAIAAHRYAVAWLASPEVSACSGVGEAGHTHGKLADCTCPAACAGLYDVAIATPLLASEVSAEGPSEAPRLLSVSASPPTPPPRA